ncbi:MAG TPA: hypothetical protein PLX41_11085 [Bacteroidales bacterium]|nr:hypothetical protein [Bacteroidales bacterium]
MERRDIFLLWFDLLNNDEKEKFDFIIQLLSNHSDKRFHERIIRYELRRKYALYQYKSHDAFARDELYKAIEELSRLESISGVDFLEITNQLIGVKEIIERIDKSDESRLPNDIWDLMDEFDDKQKFLYMTLISSSGLFRYFLGNQMDWSKTDWSSSDNSDLRYFDKIIEIISIIKTIVFLSLIIITQTYKTEVRLPERKLTFKDIFQPRYRDTIPEEVVKLLGPSQANAWEYESDNQKLWIYPGPQNAIMIPFFLLYKMGYLTFGLGDKKRKVTAWLKEFGVEYKERTFDEPSKVISHYEFFAEYLYKLDKK